MASRLPPSQRFNAYGGRGPLILGVSVTEFAIATVLVRFRVYFASTKVISRAGWTLYWTCASWLLGTIAQVFLVMSTAYGVGNHAIVLGTHSTLTTALKWAWIAQIVLLLAIGLGKAAVVNFLLSVQGPTFPKKRWFLIFLAATNLAIDTACLFEIAFHCSPPSAQWDPTAGVCHYPERNLAMGYFTGSWNAATDLTLACYPIVLFWDIRISRLVKLGLCLLLGLGSFAAICSGIKTWQIHVIINTKDPSYDLSSLLIWAWTEMWLVLILTSIAPLWPVLKIGFERFTSVISKYKGSSSPANSIPLHDHPAQNPKKQTLFSRKKVTLRSGEFPDDRLYMTRDINFQDNASKGHQESPTEEHRKDTIVLPDECV